MNQASERREHVKVIEEVLPIDCMYGECEHGDDDCPTVATEVCSDCRESFEDGEIELLTYWDAAEARGHISAVGGVSSE